ncbi:glucan biosynthesis protein [Sphingobium sp.]|uniref:glucan biosynthesis protein n=1 Tax=Sphingobium sp. TaxID=1912891 RepID=UPI003BB7B5BC
MTQINRRAMIAATSAAILLPRPLLAQNAAEPFSWDRLVAMAQRLGRTPFKEAPLYPAAQAVDYTALHQARFRDDRTLWGDLPGDTGVRFFPLSRNAAQPVAISIVDKGRATPLRYDPAMFDAPADNPVKKLSPDAGFAGFRIMNAARDGDWLSFLGASYFRAPSPQGQFGLSARAIAINTGIQGKEEFPRFTHFWLERTGASSVTIHALLDGASITGAFRFVSTLGKDGVRQDVTAALFPRRAIPELGLMPMTSMFWYDQANKMQGTDWRPEIHDSDMLSIASADGAIQARPLFNPANPLVSTFVERSPKGFGLVQRDRNFDHYQDDGVYYDRRPTLWASSVKPLGAGQVRLYTFPTDSEFTDNVAAYWTPDVAPRPGARIDINYRLDWSGSGTPAGKDMAIVSNIWRGHGDSADIDRMVVDFSGLPEGTKPDIWADLTGGTIVKKGGYPVLGQGGLFRVAIDIKREPNKNADVRVQLRAGDRSLSEYIHYPIGA